MAGVSGADVQVAYAVSSTWGTAASVTQKVLLTSTEGLDSGPALVDDEAFAQTFLGEGEVGDFPALTPELEQQLRYEGSAINWIALSMGSPSAPTVVSSQGANSLVAYQHVINLATSIAKFITLAVDEVQHVVEVPTMKLRGFTLKGGDNGRMLVSFPGVGNKTVYNSAVNTNSTVGGATAAPMANRVYRSKGVVRLALQSLASSLTASNSILVSDVSVSHQVPLTTGDVAWSTDSILEPEVDGWAEETLEMTFPRMNTVSANSLSRAWQAGTVLKGDITFTGAYINSTSQRSIKLEFPALQVTAWKAAVTGHNQVRPTGSFRAKMATNTPTGMTFVYPMRVTVINTNSATLC